MEKGAYIYYTPDDTIDLFLFMKSNYDELQKALPINYHNGEILDTHDSLQVIFHNGMDYLGSGELKNIPKIINQLNAVDLLNNSLENLHILGFSSLTKQQYNNMINFSNHHLRIDKKID